MTAAHELTADQARHSVVTVGRAIVAAVGTAPWTFIAGPEPGECTRADGTAGVSFAWAARGPVVTDHRASAAAAHTALTAHGYDVTVQTVSKDAIRVVGRSDQLGVAEFDTRSTADGIVVTSSCAHGTRSDYLDQKSEGLLPTPSASS